MNVYISHVRNIPKTVLMPTYTSFQPANVQQILDVGK